jgi:hypothetical protein
MNFLSAELALTTHNHGTISLFAPGNTKNGEVTFVLRGELKIAVFVDNKETGIERLRGEGV